MHGALTPEPTVAQESLPAAVPQKLLPAWTDKTGRELYPYPLPLPDLQVDTNVFMPTQGSYLIWKFLYREGIGKDKKWMLIISFLTTMNMSW